MNLPNRLTVLRLFLALLYLGFMSVDAVLSHAVALVIFIAAAITDFLDGNIARKYNLITSFGKLMDPLADKVLMLAAFVMMMQLPSISVPGWAVVLILAREFLVTGLRTIAAAEGAVLEAIGSGKAKTVAQIVFVIVFSVLAIGVDIARLNETPGVDGFVFWLQWVSFAAFLAITALTVQSGIAFARANWQRLHLNEL